VYIYEITNHANGKTYIGMTINPLKKRFKSHICNSFYDNGKRKTHLQNAIVKYGPENFSIRCLDDTVTNEDDLGDRETEWIAKLNPEYNMTKGGEGGWIHDQTGNTWTISEKGRENMRKAKAESKKKPGYRKSIERRAKKISGHNNYQSRYEIMTPWGKFYTWMDATNEAKRLRKEGRIDVVTDGATLKKYCHGKKLKHNGRRTLPEWRGKHTHELGFGLKERSDK